MAAELILQFAGYAVTGFVTGFGAYLAIRVDLARLQVEMAGVRRDVDRLIEG